MEKEINDFMRGCFITYKMEEIRIYPDFFMDYLRLIHRDVRFSKEAIKKYFKNKGYANLENASVIKIPIGITFSTVESNQIRYYMDSKTNSLPIKRYWICKAEDWISEEELNWISEEKLKEYTGGGEKVLITKKILNRMSFSEIVNELQGDKDKGIKMLISFAEEQKEALEQITEAEQALERANAKYNSTMACIKNVCQHLELRPHFVIREKKKCYQITPEFQAHINDVDYEV